MATRPTEDEIVAALRDLGKAMTCMVADRLRANHGYDLPTAWVLGRLYKLAAAGKVRQVPTVYAVQKRWSVV